MERAYCFSGTIVLIVLVVIYFVLTLFIYVYNILNIKSAQFLYHKIMLYSINYIYCNSLTTQICLMNYNFSLKQFKSHVYMLHGGSLIGRPGRTGLAMLHGGSLIGRPGRTGLAMLHGGSLIGRPGRTGLAMSFLFQLSLTPNCS